MKWAAVLYGFIAVTFLVNGIKYRNFAYLTLSALFLLQTVAYWWQGRNK